MIEVHVMMYRTYVRAYIYIIYACTYVLYIITCTSINLMLIPLINESGADTNINSTKLACIYGVVAAYYD